MYMVVDKRVRRAEDQLDGRIKKKRRGSDSMLRCFASKVMANCVAQEGLFKGSAKLCGAMRVCVCVRAHCMYVYVCMCISSCVSQAGEEVESKHKAQQTIES